jgi:hypothetical protein
MNVNAIINHVKDPSVRRALKAIFDQLTTDLDANKATFLAHVHPMVLSYGGLAAKATADADLKTVADIIYLKSAGTLGKVATGNIDVSGVAGYTPVALAAAKQRYFLLTLNLSTDALGITEGVDHASACVQPATPAGHLLLGTIKVVNGTAVDFVFGTTHTDEASLTITYADVGSTLNQATAFDQHLSM